MIAYLDTSAAMKLVLDEPQSEALATELSGREDRQLVSSWLLHTEMHCAAGRHPEDVDLGAVQAVLDTVGLIDITRGDMLAAGTQAPLRSNDAIHLAVALRTGADEMVTYDAELADRAAAAGLSVLMPGISRRRHRTLLQGPERASAANPGLPQAAPTPTGSAGGYGPEHGGEDPFSCMGFFPSSQYLTSVWLTLLAKRPGRSPGFSGGSS